MAHIHPSADVKTEHIGEDTRIWQNCVVLKGARIGRNCNINAHVLIEGDVVVGDNVTVKCGVYLWDGLRVADNVFIGPNVTFTNDRMPRSKRYPETFQQTHIGKGASIGAGSIILGGVTIGEYALIGAGSLVTKDVPARELWYGSPARKQGRVCECGTKLADGQENCGRDCQQP
jgi:UDP-2-acetamido-3-amino-2,3-dideoxy-glucuronate N-acetyltransferase